MRLESTLVPVATSAGCGASCPLVAPLAETVSMRGRKSLDVSRKSPTATQTPLNPHDVSSSATSAEAPDPAFPGTGAVDAVQLPPERWSRRPAVPPAVVLYSPEISHTAAGAREVLADVLLERADEHPLAAPRSRCRSAAGPPTASTCRPTRSATPDPSRRRSSRRGRRRRTSPRRGTTRRPTRRPDWWRRRTPAGPPWRSTARPRASR